MTSAKRLFIATLMGIICGFICVGLAGSGENVLPGVLKLQIILSRTMIGFVIGISGIKLNWALHGLLIGLVIGIPMAVSSTMGAPEAGFSAQGMFFSSLIIGAIYGFLIELVTSVIFRSGQKRCFA